MQVYFFLYGFDSQEFEKIITKSGPLIYPKDRIGQSQTIIFDVDFGCQSEIVEFSVRFSSEEGRPNGTLYQKEETYNMGIDKFGTFMKARAPDLFHPIRYRFFKGKRLGFDMHNLTFRLFYRCQGRALDKEALTFAKQLEDFEASKYMFIFDGCTRGSKPVAHAKRKKVHKRQIAKVDYLEEEVARAKRKCEEVKLSPEKLDIPGLIVHKYHTMTKQDEREKELQYQHDKLVEEKEKAQVTASRPGQTHFDIMKTVFTDVFGAETIFDAPDEGEREVALLVKQGKLDYGISEDFDTLAFGCPALIVKFMTKDMSVIYLDEVLANLDLSLEEFIDFAILCGCDYTPKVPGIAIGRGYDVISKYKTIEKAWKPKLRVKFKSEAEKKAFRYQFARDKFLHRCPTPPPPEPTVEKEEHA